MKKIENANKTKNKKTRRACLRFSFQLSPFFLSLLPSAMLRLKCAAQTYAWGRPAAESEVIN